MVLINTTDTVTLEAITAGSIPAAETGQKGDITWLHQKYPGDANGDWAGMEYAIALASKGDLKVVSLVTSYDIKKGRVLNSAIELAKDTIREKESKLVEKHEKRWQEYCRKSITSSKKLAVLSGTTTSWGSPLGQDLEEVW